MHTKRAGLLTLSEFTDYNKYFLCKDILFLPLKLVPHLLEYIWCVHGLNT